MMSMIPQIRYRMAGEATPINSSRNGLSSNRCMNGIGSLSDDDLSRLQGYLNENPQAGDIIRESGGVRKLRWGAPGRGKRGGFRIIYYLRSQQDEIWLLTLYAKNASERISARILKTIKEEIDG